MPQQRLRAVFMRGGTSKAVMFRQDDLPADRDAWAPIFLAVENLRHRAAEPQRR